MKPDFYSILKVTKDASFKAIHDSYGKLSLKYHPDINPDSSTAQEKFISISEAFSILFDPERRKYYDKKLFYLQKYKPGHSFHIDEVNRSVGKFDLASALRVFMNFIRKNGDDYTLKIGKNKKVKPFQGSNIKINVPLTLQEISLGCKKTIHISHDKKCQNCNGSGTKGRKSSLIPCSNCADKVKERLTGHTREVECSICCGTGQIPENPCPVCNGKGIYLGETVVDVTFLRGISEGNFTILEGLGNTGIRGNDCGDLLLFIEERVDEKYVRHGYNIETELTVPVTSAVLGETFEVEDITGQKQTFRINPGTQPEDVYKIEGRGLPFYYQDGVGDLYVRIHVEIPKILSEDAHQYFSNFVQQIDSTQENAVPRKKGNYYIIDFNPDEKTANYRSAFQKAERVLASSTRHPIVFNLDKIDIIESIVVGMMIKIHKQLTACKLTLILIGLSDMVLEIIKDCSLDKVFTIIDNESTLDLLKEK